MFRFFENLVDPYSKYEDHMDPPSGLMQYLVYHTKPFRTLFLITGIATILAAVFEIFLLAAIGWVVDLMAAETPASLWENYAWHFIGLLAFVLTFKTNAVSDRFHADQQHAHPQCGDAVPLARS
jgi:ATP-binding cassette subfamily B multidrug efflux pump